MIPTTGTLVRITGGLGGETRGRVEGPLDRKRCADLFIDAAGRRDWLWVRTPRGRSWFLAERLQAMSGSERFFPAAETNWVEVQSISKGEADLAWW